MARLTNFLHTLGWHRGHFFPLFLLRASRETGPQVYGYDIPSFPWISPNSMKAPARITVLESDFYGTRKVRSNGLRNQASRATGRARTRSRLMENPAGS